MGIGLVLSWVSEQPMYQGACWCCWHFFYQGPVGLLGFLVGKEGIESGQGLRGFCKKHYARCGPVQTVHHAQINIPGLVVSFLEIGLGDLAQGPITCLIALHNVSRALVHNNEVIVLIEYL